MGDIEGLELGSFGVWTFDFEFQPAAQMRDSIQELEALGWRAFWIPELIGREAFTHAAYLLSCTKEMHVVNGIARIWSRDANATHGASLLLADAFPGRHLVGLGVSGPRPGAKPLAAMNAYLDELDDLASVNPGPRPTVRRVLAAYGPKMLELARERSCGAHTYKVNVEHTRHARQILGPNAFLGVEHAVLFESDPTKARATAREHLSMYLNSPFNVAKFQRLGYSEADLAGGGSDRFVDDLVFWGDLDAIVDKLREQVDAGADHVGIQVIGVAHGESAMPYWRALGEALLPDGS